MKYHTLGSSNIAAETKTSGFTLYADMGVSENKITYSETDMKKIREELQNVQKDLKLQTKRCRYLVAEYTRKLQEKEQLYQTEKVLRDTQLAKVLRALLIFEARLRQEQKLISHQLNEKDYIINTQSNDIKKLLSNQYCKNCNQYYTSPNLESFDSSSEYVLTEHDYQSSNLESLDSSSENYGTSEREYTRSESDIYEKFPNNKNLFQKNRCSSQGRRKVIHRKSNGTYFEVLKLRNDSPISNDDNTSADYDNLDSLPPESISDKISVVSENIENIFNKTRNLTSPETESSTNISSSECDKTVINTAISKCHENDAELNKNNSNINKSLGPTEVKEAEKKLTETIPVFEGGGDTNDNWYASASDQEDEDHRNIYRNNPVLECMNQILLQNINDVNSPPKTPNIERKSNKNNKRVKFSDEEEKSTVGDCGAPNQDDSHDYYETPIQKTPNFYETPQSIYSNDYEQILSKCSNPSSESSTNESEIVLNSKESDHYIEMENAEEPDKLVNNTNNLIRKNKILRVPPALPPKPPNLVAKCKIQTIPKKPPSEANSTDLEPDYCSISELNLPQNKAAVKKISVVVDIHNDVKNRMSSITQPPEEKRNLHKNISKEEVVPSLVVKKCVEKFNIQLAKNTSVKSEVILNSQSPKKKTKEMQIPKLPQVSEIIIPDDPEESEEDHLISQDNYIKNNTQMQVGKTSREPRKPIVMGSSVSSLISGFNNHQLLNEIKMKHERTVKLDAPRVFSSFESLQNLDKHYSKSTENNLDVQSFENFDLSQNFEEFKLDDCEIEEYNVEEELEKEEKSNAVQEAQSENKQKSSRPSSIEILKKQLLLQRNQNSQQSHDLTRFSNQPTYEHFLACTGLSSKSLMTPSKVSTNHKHMLKPKDVKLRSKVKASAHIFEKNGGSQIKYWSEPFV